jgi:hypothetical protein
MHSSSLCLTTPALITLRNSASRSESNQATPVKIGSLTRDNSTRPSTLIQTQHLLNGVS